MSESLRNILVMLPGPMGDTILATPALRCLRESLPGVRLTCVAQPGGEDMLAGGPWCDEMITFDKKSSRGEFFDFAGRLSKSRFEAAILLPNSFRSALLAYLAGIPRRIGYERQGRGVLLTDGIRPVRMMGRYLPMSMLDYYYDLAGYAVEALGGGTPAPLECRLELFTTQEQERQAEALWTEWEWEGAERVAIMVPGGAFGPSKFWPVERFAAVADRLSEDGMRVILSCAPNAIEREIAGRFLAESQQPVINLLDYKINLGTLMAIIRRCGLMVANDTGPCHIAAGFGVPLVTLFGPTDPRWTATACEKEIRLRRDVVCGPCQLKVCPLDHRCLERIGVKDVYRACRKLLDAPETSTETETLHNVWFVGSDSGKLKWGHHYRPYHESFVRMGDDCGVVHGGYAATLAGRSLGSLEEVFAFNEGELLSKPGLKRRERLRIKLDAGENISGNIYLKRYYPPGMGEQLQRWLQRRSRATTAEYDFNAAVRLAELGILTPRPVACGAERRGPFEGRSFVMLEELPDGDALERMLPRAEALKKKYTLLARRRELLTRVAELARKLHDAGYYHRDFYLSHIFLCKDLDGREACCLIDLFRVFRPLVFRSRWRVKDLSQLYYSSRAYVSRTECVRFLRAYWQCGRLDRRHKIMMRAIAKKTRRIEQHDRKRQARLKTQETMRGHNTK